MKLGNPWLDSHKEIFDGITIAQLLGKQYNHLSQRIENWTDEASGWIVRSIFRQHDVLEIAPGRGCLCFFLPKELKKTMKGLINV